MSSLNLKASWSELKGKLKQQYTNLTDEDLTYTEGKEDELYGRLQKKLGKSKDDIVNIINHMIEPGAHENKDHDQEHHGRKVVDHNKGQSSPMRRG